MRAPQAPRPSPSNGKIEAGYGRGHGTEGDFPPAVADVPVTRPRWKTEASTKAHAVALGSQVAQERRHRGPDLKGAAPQEACWGVHQRRLNQVRNAKAGAL